MFIVIMVLLLGTCISVLSSIYYNTISLQNTYWTINAYYWAYYWAVSSMERGLLMSKLKYPTYVWSWWFKWNNIIWSKSNMFSGNFWRLSHSNNTMIWTVNSRTTNVRWNLDTKTIRTISFTQYSDPNTGEYKNEGITSTVNWIKNGLTFSWTANPNGAWRSTNKLDINVDFNWFFSMIDPTKTVRWLLKGKRNDDAERDVPLTWSFVFWDNAVNSWVNPRPTLSWKFSDQSNIWY